MSGEEPLFIARFDSPIGSCAVASTRAGLAYLELPHASGRGLAGWRRRFAADVATREAFSENRCAVTQVLEYLEGKRTRFDLPLDLRGTPFQREVWQALLAIPYGETRTYREIARGLSRPGASRAVGAANGANPVSLVVPCHRVVAAGGRLVGYGGGLELKARLLAMEKGSTPPGDRLL